MGINEIRALSATRTGYKAKGVPGKKMPESDKKMPDSAKNCTKPEKKPTKRINKQTKKIRAVNRKLKKAYPVFLASRPNCEIESPVCARAATVVNHNRGRGNNVLNQKDWTPCCPPCNDYIESHHAWAEERGFKISRHKKEK